MKHVSIRDILCITQKSSQVKRRTEDWSKSGTEMKVMVMAMMMFAYPSTYSVGIPIARLSLSF
jgi:hypothetical protein